MKIKEVELLSRNLFETSTFYSEVLNLEISERSDSKISFKVGNSTLTFIETTDQNPLYHFAFDIPHNKLEESLNWLSKRVDLIEFEGNPIIDFPNWKAKSLYFYDNSGNVLEFIARFANANESVEHFSALSLISISEIAFVTENVESLAIDIIKNYNVNYYERQIQSDDFSVIGDDHGLLILVDSNRNWFPTPIRVQRFPIKVIFENNDILSELHYK